MLLSAWMVHSFGTRRTFVGALIVFVGALVLAGVAPNDLVSVMYPLTPVDAVTEFRKADQLPDGPYYVNPLITLAALGRAFDHANQPDSAIAYFERFLVTPYYQRLAEDGLHRAGVEKRLGELYEARGNTAKAVEHYRAFVELWKNADPELQPRVAVVRERLKVLTPVERGKR
jgi:tetratricopeptide (TPR) repeat protein